MTGKWGIVACVLVAFNCAGGVAIARDAKPLSSDQIVEGCRVAAGFATKKIRPDQADTVDYGHAGKCFGYAEAVATLLPLIPNTGVCLPKVYSPGRIAVLVDRLIEDQPEVKASDPVSIFVMAMRKEWPCPK